MDGIPAHPGHAQPHPAAQASPRGTHALPVPSLRSASTHHTGRDRHTNAPPPTHPRKQTHVRALRRTRTRKEDGGLDGAGSKAHLQSHTYTDTHALTRTQTHTHTLAGWHTCPYIPQARTHTHLCVLADESKHAGKGLSLHTTHTHTHIHTHRVVPPHPPTTTPTPDPSPSCL